MILVTGAQGQLGRALQTRWPSPELLFLGAHQLDIAQWAQVETIGRSNPLKGIVNCAAYTNVEQAEREPQKAFLVNEKGTENVAKLAGLLNIPLIHISTDYVFDGKKSLPYQEEDPISPLNQYGLSKAAGEAAVERYVARGAIIRTSWLYSRGPGNFVHKMSELLKTKSEVQVVYDQVGTPTFVEDLADCIVRLVQQFNFESVQTFHYSNEGVASWYDVAVLIAQNLAVKTRVYPVPSHHYVTLAKRPAFSVLAKEKIKQAIDLPIPHWTESLAVCLSPKRS